MAGEKATCHPPGWSEAFSDLISRVEDKLQGCVRHQMGSNDASRDIVHMTYLAALRDDKFDPAHEFASAWLFTTARRLVLDWRRAAKRDEESRHRFLESTGTRGSRSSLSSEGGSRDPLDELIRREGVKALEAGLARLESDERAIIERFYLLQEGTQAEIAEAMGLSVAAFNTRLSRARKVLRDILIINRARRGRGETGHVST